MRILIVGASGLIGSAVAARLPTEGHSVRAVGRRPLRFQQRVEQICIDLGELTEADAWVPLLKDVDAVVNAAGVLQDSVGDSTQAVHAAAPQALFAACERVGVRRIIHFSAVGVDRETPSQFSASKRQGDQALINSALDYVILRPSVVIGQSAYGASALIRALAVLPVSLRIERAGFLQVVQLDDVVRTVLYFLQPESASRVALELVGPERLRFEDLVARYRQWFGLTAARTLTAPPWIVALLFKLGDFAGWLGWRPPMRSNAAAELVRGAVGDASTWTKLTGIKPMGLDEALSARPVAVQEKWFARLYLLKPVVFSVFSLFWIATGLMSLGPGWDIGLGLMHEGGVSGMSAPLTVIAGALADICVGLAIVCRRTAKMGLQAAFVLSLLYVVIGTLLVPRLWIDPLGPMLKIWPVLALNLVALAIVEDR